MQLQILQLQGTDKLLYKLIAPLVMDPEVLRMNNNYPFKTTQQFTWFIALEGKIVRGFIPVEPKGKAVVINNYYAQQPSDEILEQLLTAAITALKEQKLLLAIVQLEHQSIFEKCGFTTEKTWKLYVKMQKRS